MRSLFTGRRAQVVHGLLVRHQDWFGVKDLAEQTLVSSATASQVLTEMERFDWLESRGQGPSKQRHLRQPAALLDAPTLIPHMLEAFIAGDQGFRRGSGDGNRPSSREAVPKG